MATNLTFLVCFNILLFITTQIEANNAAGFTAQLHRRHNSPKTLLGDNFYTPSSYLEGGTNSTNLKSLDKGDYLMKISIGTPPVEMYGLFDTGSDLIWSHCIPCPGCSQQQVPIFDPQNSKTYRNTSCNTEECNWVPGTCSTQNNCFYKYGYGDGSYYTSGLIAWETISFSSTTGEKFVKGNIVFGCSHNGSSTTFNATTDMGIVGMGGGPLSLVSQMSTIFGGKRFSQCLVPFNVDPNNSGTVSFGADSEVIGEGTVTVPLILGHNLTYYLVTLVGVSIENTFIPYNSSVPIPKGNILIDSGTPSTWVPRELYIGIVTELKKRIKLDPINPDDPKAALCYESNSIEWPVLTFHFDGGSLEFSPADTTIEPQEGVFCFAMAWPTDDISIFGSNLQANLLIGFDLDRKTVSFKPTDCTKQLKLTK